MLETLNISLRALESKDLEFLFKLENDPSILNVSVHNKNFSKDELRGYITNANQDIVIAGQFRFVISLGEIPVGCIDLYNYDWEKEYAWVGIGILKEYRGKGYAGEGLKYLIEYCWKELSLKQLYTSILPDNRVSIRLFAKYGFKSLSNNNYLLNR